MLYIGTMLEHRIPHLLPARRNFNWYQSRHHVLFLGEIHGRYFLAIWTKKKMLYAEVEGENTFLILRGSAL